MLFRSMLTLVIFDMDGVLIDSELYWKIFERELYPTMGIEFTKEIEDAVMGIRLSDVAAYLNTEYGVEKHVVYDVYDTIVQKVYAHTHIMPGVESLLQELQRANIPAVIGSSATPAMITLAMEQTQLRPYFADIYSAGTMNIPGKPDPAIYTTIMRDMNASPHETIILEDSQHGFRAAVLSKATVVAVTDPRWCDLSKEYSEAALHVESLDGVTLQTLQSLLT